MPADPLSTICVALAIGLAAFLIASRLRIPPIVPLLLFGMAAGPSGLGLVRPDRLGQAELRGLILGSVLIILFEGSLSLRAAAFRHHRGPITRLVTVGAVVTWIGTALAAHALLGLSWQLSVLLGAVLIATGPTVVVPLLRTVRPGAAVREILHWEGILIDPIGAIAAIVAFEFIETSIEVGGAASLGVAAADYLRRAITGLSCGAVGALLIHGGLRIRNLVPRDLATPFALGVVLASCVAAESFAHESSLFAAPIAGVLLATLIPPRLGEIARFNGELTTVLLAVLFVVLAADVDLSAMLSLGWHGFAFLAAIQLVRGACVVCATAGSKLAWKERLFMAWLAPRGIVAASIASVFGAALVDFKIPGADQIVPITFLVILGTVVVQGLLARPIGHWLGVLAPPQRDVIIAGVTPFGAALARVLTETGIQATLIDRNENKVREAEHQGAKAYAGDVLSPQTYDDVGIESTGAYLAATPSDTVNGLAAELAAEILGGDAVLQLPSGVHALDLAHDDSAAMRYPLAFGERFTLASLDDALREGARIVVRELDRPKTAAEVRAGSGTDFRPLLTIDARTSKPSFVRRTRVLLPAGKLVGIDGLPPAMLAAEQASRWAPLRISGRLKAFAAEPTLKSREFRRILVFLGPDALDREGAALQTAAILAREHGSTLTVLEVPGKLPTDAARARRALERLIAPLREAGIEVSTISASGIPFVAIIRAVLRGDHDLVVKTVAQRHWFRQTFFGTTAQHLLRKCPSPLWLVKQGAPVRKLVAAVNPSSHSEGLNEHLLRVTAGLATSLECEYAVLHCWDDPDAGILELRVSPEELEKHEERVREAALDRFVDLLERCLPTIRSRQVHLMKGHPALVIPRFIEENGIDLLVLGTVARTGIPGLLIGNIAEKVLAQVQCAVLAIKPEGFVTPVTLEDGPAIRS